MSSDLEQKVLESIIKRDLFFQKEKVLIAVSGGIDSVALLYILKNLSMKMDIECYAAHLDHSIREDSHLDAKFVEEFCCNIDTPLFVEKIDIPNIRSSGNLEETARNIRYDFLERSARSFGCKVVATGHTANDRAETFLFNLMRGSGEKGLCSLKPVRYSSNIRIVRPLIDVTRDDLIKYAKEHNLSYREDSTNQDKNYSRNYIRHEILSRVKERFTNEAILSICRASDILAMDDEYLDSEANKVIKRFTERVKELNYNSLSGGYVFLISDLRDLDSAILFRLLRSSLYKLSTKSYISFANLDSIVTAINEYVSSWAIDLPDGINVTISSELIRIGKQWLPTEQFELSFNKSGKYFIEQLNLVIVVERIDSPKQWELTAASNDSAYFSPDVLKQSILVRKRKEGDKILPFGMKGRKKVHDVLIDYKVPVWDRNFIPIFESADKLLWIPNVLRSDYYKVKSEHKKCIKIKIEKIAQH